MSLLKDVRFGVRSLVKRPGFALVAVVTLALGIGANTAIFSVIDAALLRSLPYREPGRLVHLWESKRSRDFEQREASYPDLLDLKAAAGRAFVEGEDGVEGKRVAVLSHGFWQRRFGGEPGAVGREVTLDGQAYTVVGVLPAGFNFALLADPEVWTPVAPTPDVAARRYMHWVKVVGRLKEGVTLEAAQAQLSTVAS